MLCGAIKVINVCIFGLLMMYKRLRRFVVFTFMPHVFSYSLLADVTFPVRQFINKLQKSDGKYIS